MDFVIGFGIAVGAMIVCYWLFGGRGSRREFSAGDHYVPIGSQVRGGCGHPQLVEVESGREIVAWLCPKCDKQLDATDRAVQAHIDRKREKAAQAKADAEFSAMFRTPSYQDSLREEKRVLMAEQAVRMRELRKLSEESAKSVVNREA